MPGGRDALVAETNSLFAEGGTALYDAVFNAYARARTQAAADPLRIHTVVVMTDGVDESSLETLDRLREQLRGEGGEQEVRVFTIAYGQAASDPILSSIAEAGGGSSARGSVDDIVQVFRDMAAFF
jgi:Ca-activated chloride channel family protein